MLRARTIAALALVAVTVFSSWAEGSVLAHSSLAQVLVPTDPAGVLQRFQDARNQGDVDGAMQLVTDDVRYIGGSTCSSQDPCVGAGTFRRAVELSIADQVHSTTLGAALVADTTVRVSLLTTSPGRTAIGVDRTLSEVTADVVDGRIVSFPQRPGQRRPTDALVARPPAFEATRAGLGPPLEVRWRRLARSERTMKSAHPSSCFTRVHGRGKVAQARSESERPASGEPA
jgi:hypothetical protein